MDPAHRNQPIDPHRNRADAASALSTGGGPTTTVPDRPESWDAFAADFLLGPGGAADRSAATAVEDPLLGLEIGGARIVRLIGAGGMGRVYEARQQRPARPVAVKLMRPGLMSPTHLRRFEFEAEVLGRLRHPGIAAIYAAGTQVVGGGSLPYFVMEYIPGARPITRFALEAKLTPRQRLELFQDACAAVAHGHRLGVIHRDLKPANILVDDEGRVKVIDFGVACTTGADIALATVDRDVGRVVGTLEYMSPEQLVGDPDALDVRSDVYALGVVLYELLADRPPLDLRSTPFLRALTIVRDRAPPPLPPQARGLGGALAAIVGTCLERDRDRRYGSAGELAADIGRYLAGDAVVARPPSLGDTLLRLARRYRAATAAAVGVVTALLIATVGISIFAVRAERERTRAVAERARADGEAATALRRLYVANLYRIADLAAAGALGAGRALFAETLPLAATAGPASSDGIPSAAVDSGGLDRGDLPLELRVLAADLDGSILALETGGPLRTVRISPDGRLVAAGGDDGRIRIWALDDVLQRGNRAAPRILGGHDAGVRSLSFSRDSERLVSAGRDHTARIWNLADPAAAAAPLVLRGHTSELDMASFSPDGRLVATGSWDGTARLWDADSGEELHVFRSDKGRMSHAVFSPDGGRVAVGSNDGTVRIHDVVTGVERAVLRGHEGILYGVVWSPDAALVATASLDGTARIWEAADGASRQVLAGHTGWVRSVAFSPDGTLVATASEDGTARTWDVASGAARSTIRHDSAVTGIRFSPDGGRLAAISANLAASVWEVGATNPHLLRAHTDPIMSMAFAPDGGLIATASEDGTVRFWDAVRPGRVPALDGPASSRWVVAFSPTDDLVATASDDGAIRLWETALCLPRATLPGARGTPTGLAFTADGRRLAAAFSSSSDTPSRVDLWDVATGSRVTTLAAGHGVTRCPSLLSPDGRLLLTRLPAAGGGGLTDDHGLSTAALWDVAGGARRCLLEGHTQFIAASAFSPDGSRVATASYDGTARIWDTATGAEVAVLAGHEGWVTTIAYDAPGRVLVTGSHDGTARVWDAVTGRLRHVLPAAATKLQVVTLSPDGRLVATVDDDRTTTVWDVATGRRVAAFKGHAHQVSLAAFAPDSTRLATASSDGSARLWNPRTGEELLVVRHGPPIRALAFSPSGACLATAARGDASVRLWGLSAASTAAARRFAADAAR